MLRKTRRRRQVQEAELDITAFLNLMVILVPFLLITAVFSRITILDLYLPPASNEQASTKNRFQLEIIIQKDDITVRERGSGVRQKFVKRNGKYDYDGMVALLKTIKERQPQKSAASILSAPDIEYETLIQVMDRVRMMPGSDKSEQEFRDLFPNISIGDSPGRKV